MVVHFGVVFSRWLVGRVLFAIVVVVVSIELGGISSSRGLVEMLVCWFVVVSVIICIGFCSFIGMLFCMDGMEMDPPE